MMSLHRRDARIVRAGRSHNTASSSSCEPFEGLGRVLKDIRAEQIVQGGDVRHELNMLRPGERWQWRGHLSHFIAVSLRFGRYIYVFSLVALLKGIQFTAW